MNKKGAILMVVFEVIVVVSIIFIAFSIAQDLATSERVNKALLAEDLRGTINTMVAIPGEIEVQYPLIENNTINLTLYTIQLDDNYVEVRIADQANHLTASRELHLPEGYTATGAVQEEETFCLEKTGKAIILKEC